MKAKCDYYLQVCREYVIRYSQVVRDGLPRKIQSKHLVVGDLVLFNHGDQLLADVKIVQANNVTVNHKLLSVAQRFAYDQIYGDVKSRQFKCGDVMLHSSYVASGCGQAIVLNTTKHFLDQLMLQIDEKTLDFSTHPNNEDTGLRSELKTFLHYLSFIAISIGFVFSS